MINRYKLQVDKDTEKHNEWLFLFVDDTIKEIEDSTDIFEKNSLKDLAIALFRQLFVIAHDSLDNELIKEIAPDAKPPFNRLEFITNKEKADNSKILLDKLLKKGKNYFDEIEPLLLDMLNMRCSYFKNNILDMAKRIDADKTVIADELLNGKNFNSIEKINLPSNDLHNLGKFPVTITASGEKFIYKPHNCNVDVWFYHFVNKFFYDVIRVPKTLSMNNQYGYSKFIESHPAETLEKTKKYYYNVGGFLAILEALGSSDFHYENLLADNEYPVPVDFETIVEIGSQIVINPLSKNDKVYFDLPVTRKGILPLYLPSQKKDCSPLLNTDDDNLSMPIVDGKKVDVKEYVSYFIDGFKDIYSRCLENTKEIIEEIKKMDGVIRSISIGSQTYLNLFKSLCLSGNLKSVESRNKAISSYFNNITIDPKLQGFVDSVVDGLINGDIPYHYAKADAKDIYYLDYVVLRDYLNESPRELAIENINKLSLEDLSFELKLIDKQFAYATMKNFNYQKLEIDDDKLILDSKFLHRELENVFDSIESSYIKNPEDDENWLIMSEDHETKVMNTELFSGTSGLAVFFANYIDTTLDVDKKKRAIHYLDVCINKEELSLDYYKKLIEVSNQILGLQGLAGSILALCIAYRKFKQERYKRLLLKEIDLLKYVNFNSYDKADAYCGLAGLLIVICKNIDIFDSELMRKYINKIANKIIELRTLEYRDYLLWDNVGKNRPISGFGHGTIGIVEALTLAYEITGNKKYLKVSIDAYKYEHDVYSEKLNTWPDFRSLSFAYEYMHGLCSGAPGIGNSILSINKERKLFITYDEDLSRAKKACFEMLNYRDHLCCGNAAIIDFLINAYNLTKQKDYLDRANSIMLKMIERKNAIGNYVLLPKDYKTNNNPSLFFGVSGIGLEIIKLIKAIEKQD